MSFMNPSISSVREVEVECSDQTLRESYSSLLYYDAASLVTFFFSLSLSVSHCATRGTVEMGEHNDELLARLMMGSTAPPTLGDAMQPE